jgi:hypothetical protein
MTIFHSTINKDHKKNKQQPVYVSNDPMMPKPPKHLQQQKSEAEPSRERILITKEK